MEPRPEDDLMARLEAEMGEVDTSDVEDVTRLEKGELLRRHARVERELRAMGELLQPRTDAGRALHSQRAAHLIELRRRHMR
jgi:hypothetical protein